jgi:hypothetical protein
VQPYLSTARRFRWLLLAIVGVVWGAGFAAAYVEHTTTFESAATIWVVRPSPELNATGVDDPNVALIQTAASQQADVLKQLLQTKSFLRDVVSRTSLRESFEKAPDQDRYLDQMKKRFRVETLGTSLLRVSFAGRDSETPPDLVNAALIVRAERLAQARVASAAALSTLYQRQLEFAEGQALEAQQALDEFNQSHRPPLSEPDQHVQAQLRLSLDFSLLRLGDLRGRIARAELSPALLEVSGIEFQVVDEPRVANAPGGGERSAITMAIVALAAGSGLATLLTLVATLLGPRIRARDVVEHVPAVQREGLAGASDPRRRDVRPSVPAMTLEPGDGHASGPGA